MSRLSVSVPHQLGREAALERLKAKAAEAQSLYGGQAQNVSQQWEDNRLRFGFSLMGFKIGGEVVVEEGSVGLAVDLPMIAAPFRGEIERRAKAELETALA